MRVYIVKSGKEYQAEIPIANPDTEQVMALLENVTRILELPKEEVDDYILQWAKEIEEYEKN